MRKTELRLDPEPQRLLDLMLAAVNDPNQGPKTEESIIASRNWGGESFMGKVVGTEEPADVADVVDLPVPVGNDSITVRVYTPFGTGPFPIHVYYHGGAFISGSAFDELIDRSMRRRCLGTGCVVVNVEYRLAPEHRFPVGVEDAYAALAWAADNAALIHGDPNRISVGGASSGGNFSAAVSVMARDRSGPPIILQHLEIAGTDITKSSYMWRYGGPGDIKTRAQDLVDIDFYIRKPADKTNPYASPLLTPDMAGLPPAYVMSAEYDMLRDECEAYVARLTDAGIEAVARTMTGHIHGSQLLTAIWEPARRWAAEANASIRRANEIVTGPLFEGFDGAAVPAEEYYLQFRAVS